MKPCLCCKNQADDAAKTCPACGEASFGEPVAAAKAESQATGTKKGGSRAKKGGEE